MKNECTEVRALLHDWVDGELAEAERSELDSHLAACSECRVQAEGVQRLKTLVLTKAKREPTPAGFDDRLRERLYTERQDIERRGSTARRFWRSPRLAAAAAVLLIGVVVTLIFNVGSSVDHLVHAATARDALAAHRESSVGLRRMSLERAKEVLAAAGLGVQLPQLAGEMHFVGLRERTFGGWCHSYQLRFETAQGKSFSMIATPAEIVLGEGEKYPEKPWKPGCCLCVRVDEQSVICFRRGDTHFWIVTDSAPEQFYHDHVAAALRLRH